MIIVKRHQNWGAAKTSIVPSCASFRSPSQDPYSVPSQSHLSRIRGPLHCPKRDGWTEFFQASSIERETRETSNPSSSQLALTPFLNVPPPQKSSSTDRLSLPAGPGQSAALSLIAGPLIPGPLDPAIPESFGGPLPPSITEVLAATNAAESLPTSGRILLCSSGQGDLRILRSAVAEGGTPLSSNLPRILSSRAHKQSISITTLLVLLPCFPTAMLYTDEAWVEVACLHPLREPTPLVGCRPFVILSAAVDALGATSNSLGPPISLYPSGKLLTFFLFSVAFHSA